MENDWLWSEWSSFCIVRAVLRALVLLAWTEWHTQIFLWRDDTVYISFKILTIFKMNLLYHIVLDGTRRYSDTGTHYGTCQGIGIDRYTGCPRRNVPDFGRMFLMLKYTDITQNTYIRRWTVTEIMAREVWNFDSCYTLIDYQIHIETGRNMWFL